MISCKLFKSLVTGPTLVTLLLSGLSLLLSNKQKLEGIIALK